MTVTKASGSAVNEKHKAEYFNTLGLIDLLLSLLAHTADCENGFPLMKLTKSDWRNWLGDKVLSSLMRIQMKSSSVCDYDYDFGETINLWLHSKGNTICCKHHIQKQKRKLMFDPMKAKGMKI
ncbi:hypothetical protein PR048_026213 [Dryococelus australis]|uniref:Uncharacterized protein n=1 Tax=Dryococelus australis TaxID=614101 RepID=A0ABQ9GKS9_9NEOP|nr:hypothetical protein PR048_026213 [Dryococelus australis]